MMAKPKRKVSRRATGPRRQTNERARTRKAKGKETGRDYELITKAIFKELHRQNQVDNVEVRHNVILQGKLSKHQIDVYWKFSKAGIEHQAVVQVKKEKYKAKLGHIMTFAGVLADLIGQPRGIFLTLSGYQEGALDHARKAGIVLLQLIDLAKASSPPITMTNVSQATIEILLSSLQTRMTVYNTNFGHISLRVDQSWLDDKFKKPADEIKLDLTTLPIKFENESGEVRETFGSRVQEFVRSNHYQGGLLRIEFPEPTYVRGVQILEPPSGLDHLKVYAIEAEIKVDQQIHMRPLIGENLTPFLLKYILEEEQRQVWIDSSSAEPRAVIPSTDKI